MERAIVFLAGAEPLRLPATAHLYVIKPEGVTPNVACDGPMTLLSVESMTVDAIIRMLRSRDLIDATSRIACVDEQYIMLAAKLREVLGLPGQSFMSARAFRNKFFMKEYLKSAEHFRLPTYWSPLQRKEIATVFPPDKSGTRVVKKPILGSGGMEVVIADSVDALGEVAQDELVESFVDLPMLHVDGLIVAGEIRLFVISKYINFCLSFTDFQYVGSEFSHDAGLNGRVEAAMREIFQLLPSFQDGAFHLEMFHSDSELVFCEIASRPGGIGIVRALEEAYGVNLYQASFEAQCGSRLPGLSTRRITETSWLLVPHGVPLALDPARLDAMPWLVDYFVAEDLGREKSLHCADGKFKAVLKGHTLREVADRRRVLLSSIGYA